MKKLLLSTVSLFALLFANAQTPALEWAKTFVGNSEAYGYSIAVDSFGNVYTTGYFGSLISGGTVDFNPGIGVDTLTSEGSKDFFISKLDALGNFIWVKQIGGVGTEEGYSIAVDAIGNVYTTGYFTTTTIDFDPGVGITNLTTAGSGDIFVLKLDALGNFVWAKSMGGTLYDHGYGIALDGLGNVYTTGHFKDTCDFDPGVGTFDLISSGMDDIFISKLDSFGNFVWAKQIGESSTDVGTSIVVDDSGNVYSAGYFYGVADFDPGSGTTNLTSAGAYDEFVIKLNTSGNFIWAKNMGGMATDIAKSIAVDVAGNVYTTGQFQGTADFDPNSGILNLTSAGGDDIFVSKLDSSGNFVWAKSMGGTVGNFGLSIALDPLGNVYTTGNFSGTADFDPGPGTTNLTSGSSNVFISKLDASGDFLWVASLGGTSSDIGYSIAVDVADNVYTTGRFAGTIDFDPGAGMFNVTTGYYSCFVHKMSQQIPTGINVYSTDNPISIYPNPSKGEFNIIVSELKENAIIEVYNSIGALVFSKEIVSGQATIELVNQTNGLYLVKVISENEIIGTRKIIKE